MTNAYNSNTTDEVVGRLADPDPFQLPRRMQQRVRCCSSAGCGHEEQVKYLWIDLSGSGGSPGNCALGLDDWLAVVDEAASLGAGYVVFSVSESPSAFPEIWEIAQWAAENYKMMLGLHSRSGIFTETDFKALLQLGAENCVVFVAKEHRETFEALERHGLQVLLSFPDDHAHHVLCDMPSEMIFVNPEGRLYTCGMVRENPDYNLGHILEKKLNHVVHDPSLPHAVPEKAVHDAHGCDGCPPLVTRQLHK